MSILTGFKKVKNYILTSSGYQLLSRWTSSQTVEFDDGKTAQTKLGEINGIAKTYVDMKKATDNSMAVSAKAVMEGLENSSALISMTQAEYDALSDEEKTDNNMRAILDANPDVVDAKNVNFDNTNTNLTATNTQSAITELNGKLVNIIRYTTIKGNTDGNGIIYIGQQAPDGAMPILVQIGDSTKWFECTILSKSIDNAQHFAARIRNADGSAYANIKNMVIGVLWGV